MPAFGVDRHSPDKWSAGYEHRKTTGFSHPDNKQNLIAAWLIALYDATAATDLSRPRHRLVATHALSHDFTRENGKYFVWNYAGTHPAKPVGL